MAASASQPFYGSSNEESLEADVRDLVQPLGAGVGDVDSRNGSKESGRHGSRHGSKESGRHASRHGSEESGRHGSSSRPVSKDDTSDRRESNDAVGPISSQMKAAMSARSAASPDDSQGSPVTEVAEGETGSALGSQQPPTTAPYGSKEVPPTGGPVSIKDYKKKMKNEDENKGSREASGDTEQRNSSGEVPGPKPAFRKSTSAVIAEDADGKLDPIMTTSIHDITSAKGNKESGNAGGNRMSAMSMLEQRKEDNRAPRCCSCIFRLKKWLSPRCRQLNKSRHFQVTMFICLLSALFLPDLWVLFDRSDNMDLDVILTIVLLAFLCELFVQAVGLSKTYFGSFFFWMDLLGAASLPLDLTYLPFLEMMSGGGAESNEISGNVVIMRAARIAKLGARAGRFTRLVKLLRFLPGMRQQEEASTAKVISARLITALSTRVSCLIILMVMIMPMFSMWTYPEQDWSMKSWIDILDKTVSQNPERLSSQTAKLEAFYADMDYFPFILALKEDKVGFASTVTDQLPWASRGKPDRKTNILRLESAQLVCEYNFKKPNQVDALMNVCLLIFVMFLMVGFSLVLSSSVSAIVLRPLEKLLLQVRKMASTIFQSVTDMAVNMRDNDDDNEDEEVDLDDDTVEQPATFGNETELLEKVVAKLAVLSEITMSKTVVDAETMEGLGEGDRAVINGFQGGQNDRGHDWPDEDEDDDNPDEKMKYEELLSAQKAMLENAGLSLDLLDSWNLNALELDKARNHAAGMYIVGPHNHGIQFDPVTMSQFLETAELGYVKTVPYHNWFHAVDVAHCVYRLIHLCNCEAFLSSPERYALLVAALTHDLGHPGLNNTFLIETSHALALRYNDKSPLENMHCAKLFEIVSQPRANVFASLSKPQFQEVRKLCIEAILHTDNAQHFGMIKEVQMVYEVNSEILDAWRDKYSNAPEEASMTQDATEMFRQPESRRLLVNLLLHVADISNSTKPFRVCRIWAWQVLEEFFIQGDSERKLGLPVQALNDRESVNRPFSQVGFIEFLVSPLLFAVMKVLPPTEPLAEQMVRNLKSWHQQWQSETKPPPSEQDKKALVDRISKLEARFQEAHQ